MTTIQFDTKPSSQSTSYHTQVNALVDEFGLVGGDRSGSKRKRRGLDQEIEYWENQRRAASDELAKTTSTLPDVLHQTQNKLQTFLSSAQTLSLERYDLADRLTNLVGEISEDDSILNKMKGLQNELKRLEAGLAWVSILERVTVASEKTLSTVPRVAAVPHYKSLHDLVELAKTSLPDLTLVTLITQIRDKTWKSLKDLMSQDLIKASEAIHWPRRVEYPSIPASDRRKFERAYQDLLHFQIESEALRGLEDGDWTCGQGIFPLQALVRPIAQRFRYHFQGSRNTNRADKPEWGFTHILDQIYEHQSFLSDYIQPLTSRAGLTIDVQSEFIMLLLPIPLSFLRSRIPTLLSHPGLLAHTIYQTVLFDETIRENGFDLAGTSIYDDGTDTGWEGLAGVILREEDWFTQWLEGERKFAEGQLQTIISSPDAWSIIDEGDRPTISARQIKSLVEQITDRYSPLPSSTYQLPFLQTIQLPLLQAYAERIQTSLEAFETLSSSFVRAVPGALAGSGGNLDQGKLTHGKSGLERLCKALGSCVHVLGALERWADEIFFVELSAESRSGSGSVFDPYIERYRTLMARAEDMIVRHVTVEVETDLKQHLTRRWDPLRPSETEYTHDASLTNSLTTLTNHLSTPQHHLQPLTTTTLYRRITAHISNHIIQRAVYSGWSKFSLTGGREFENEIRSWISASREGLMIDGLGGVGVEIPVEGPWIGLVGISRVLSLPVDSSRGEEEGGTEEGEKVVTLGEGLDAAWGDERGLERFCERLGVEFGRVELQGILRRREECRR